MPRAPTQKGPGQKALCRSQFSLAVPSQHHQTGRPRALLPQGTPFPPHFYTPGASPCSPWSFLPRDGCETIPPCFAVPPSVSLPQPQAPAHFPITSRRASLWPGPGRPANHTAQPAPPRPRLPVPTSLPASAPSTRRCRALHLPPCPVPVPPPLPPAANGGAGGEPGSRRVCA